MKVLLYLLFGLCSILGFSQNILQAEYFIDSDPGAGLGTSLNISTAASIDQDFAMDVTGLEVGRHTIFMRVKQENGFWSIVARRNFFVFDPTDLIVEEVDRNLVAAEYFIDEDPGIGLGTGIPVTETDSLDQNFDFNTNGLAIGRHDIFVRTKGKDGLWSTPIRRPFFVSDTTTGEFVLFRTNIVAAEFFIDDDPGPGKAESIPLQRTDTASRSWAAATDGLQPGKHKLVVRTQNEDGVWSVANTNEFFLFDSNCNFAGVDFTFDTVGIDTDINLQDLSINVSTDAVYSWDLNADGSIESTDSTYSLQFNQAGVYPLKLTVENENGCSRSIVKDIYVIDNTPAPLALAGTQRILAGQNLELTAANGFSYEWSTGATTQSITVDEEGEYYVWYTANGITWRSKKVFVEIYEPLSYSVTFRPATTGIANGTASILDLKTDGLAYEVSWSDGSSVDLIRNGLASGNYTVTVTTELESVEETFTLGTIGSAEGIVSAEYFIDTDPGTGNGIALTVNQSSEIEFIGSFSTSALSTGKHDLFIRTKSINGFWGIPKRQSFFVSDESNAVVIESSGPIVYAEYSVDGSSSVGSGTEIPLTASGELVEENFSLDVNGLTLGQHSLLLRTRAQNGAWSIEKVADFQICNSVPNAIIASDTVVCSGTSVNYQIAADAGNFITWYDSTKTSVREGVNLTSWNLTNVKDSTLYYVTQRNAEGCESALSPFYVVGRETEIFAGSDLNLEDNLSNFTLSSQIPQTGGTWTGNFVTPEGVFDVATAGLGSTTTLTYTVDSLGCSVSDQLQVSVVPTTTISTPELTITAAELGDTTLVLSDSLDISFTLSNQSLNTDGPNVDFALFISNDDILESFDGLLFSDTIDMVARSDYPFNFKVDLPDSLTFQSYNLIISVDHSGSISEGNEGDNQSVLSFRTSSIPEFVTTSLAIEENPQEGSSIGTLDVVDPDGGILNFYFADSLNIDFVDLDTNTGELFVKDSSLYNHEAIAIFSLNMGATDMQDSVESEILVSIVDVNELAADSTILAQFYNGANGSEWSGANNWLASEISNWEGLTIVDNRVTQINLQDFNLSGNVINLGGLSGIDIINLSNNQISSIEVQTLNDSVLVDLTENLLDFQQIIQNTSLSGFQFNPQKELLETDTVIAQQNTSIDLSREIPGADSYQWKKRDLSTGEVTDINATQWSFVLNVGDFTSEGAYFVEASSAEVAGLIIISTPILVKVSSLERDQLALLAIYDSLSGSDWSGDANNWSDALPIADWGGITLDAGESRVIGLNLSDNSISGKIPRDILDLRSIETIDLSDNEIIGLPNLSSLPSLTNVDVSGNRMDFFELNRNITLDDAVNFIYAPQREIINEFSGQYDQGTDVTIRIPSRGSNNLFTWNLDPAVGEIREVARGTGLDSLNLTNIGYEELGVYSLGVTNTDWPDLTITTEPIVFDVVADFSVEVNDNNGNLIPESVDGYLLLTTQVERGFDTLSVATNQSSAFTFNDVILGDYIISIDSDREKYIPTYFSNAFEWTEADTVMFRTDSAFQVSMTLVPRETQGDGSLDVVIEEDFGETSGRIDARRRAAKRKCGLRRKRSGGRTGQNDDDFELIAYGETDDNGEFKFGQLPQGTYRFFVEYPGIPIDDASFVEFEVGEAGISDTDFRLEAFATPDGITISIDAILGIILEYFKDLQVYPNPTTDLLKIQYRHLADKNVGAKLIDLSGNMLWNTDIRSGYDGYEEIDVSGFEAGVYILHVYDKKDSKKNVASYRIVIRE